MTLETATMAGNKLRKRNIHRQEDETDHPEMPSASRADVDNNESKDSFFRTILPSPLRQCIKGGERDMTQNVLQTPEREQFQKNPASYNESEYSTSCAPKADLFADDTSELPSLNVSYNACTEVSTDLDSSNLSSNSDSSNLDSEYDYETSDKARSFLTFRLSYLFVTLVVMLADGLQGKKNGSKAWCNAVLTITRASSPNFVLCLILCFRYPSLRFIRRLRIFGCLPLLFGFPYRCRYSTHYRTTYRSIWAQKVGTPVLCPRGWQQCARTIPFLERSHCQPGGWRRHHQSFVHRL